MNPPNAELGAETELRGQRQRELHVEAPWWYFEVVLSLADTHRKLRAQPGWGEGDLETPRHLATKPHAEVS